MMIFEKMGLCGDLDFFPAPLKKVEVKLEVVVSQNQIESNFVVDDDYSDKEIDVDEPNFDVLDQFYLLSLYSMVIFYVLICRNKDCKWVLKVSSMNESKIDAYMRSGC
ncbi:hypothetical protein P3L10_016007 [Capsicum annuum]